MSPAGACVVWIGAGALLLASGCSGGAEPEASEPEPTESSSSRASASPSSASPSPSSSPSSQSSGPAPSPSDLPNPASLPAPDVEELLAVGEEVLGPGDCLPSSVRRFQYRPSDPGAVIQAVTFRCGTDRAVMFRTTVDVSVTEHSEFLIDDAVELDYTELNTWTVRTLLQTIDADGEAHDGYREAVTILE